MEELETNEAYQAFTEKFKPKLTTDDCYTPEPVYDAVLAWATREYHLEGREILRPFWPGADYLSIEYPAGCVVVDNPPFSRLSQICAFYDGVGIDYFLFAPALTLFSINSGRDHFVLSDSNIIYQNQARVRTGFVTSLGEHKILTAPDLHDALIQERKTQVPKYSYPDSVITPATLQQLAAHGIRFELDPDEVMFTRTLDNQRKAKKSLFGAGFILSPSAERRHTEALQQARQNQESATGYSATTGTVWTLSESEELMRRLMK